MKKNLFATALACALTLTGFALFAQESEASAKTGHAFVEKSKIQFNSNGNVFSASSGGMQIAFAAKNDDMLKNLKAYAEKEEGGKKYGFLADGQFVSLQKALETSEDTSSNNDGETFIRLRKFSAQNLQFGIGSSVSDFESFTGSASEVSADPQFYGGYNAESFYSVDFAEKPFDGMIDILIMPEPLPAPTVTLIIALAASAVFLLYKNRKQRGIRVEQA